MTTLMIIVVAILFGWSTLYLQDAMKEYQAAIVYKEEKLKYLITALSAVAPVTTVTSDNKHNISERKRRIKE